MKLVQPSIEYEDSYLTAVAEYQKEHQHTGDYLGLHIDDLRDNFPAYIQQLKNQAKGIDLPKGYVPQSLFWLIDENEFIGRAGIRHVLSESLLRVGGHIGYDIRPSKRHKGYGKKILELVLPQAKKLGIEKVLVTCDETNTGSKKIIEANGGMLENIVEVGPQMPRKLRYWILLE